MIEQGICYLTLADKGYPKRLAFLYLEQIHQEFVDELRHDHGKDWRHKVRSCATILGKFGARIDGIDGIISRVLEKMGTSIARSVLYSISVLFSVPYRACWQV